MPAFPFILRYLGFIAITATFPACMSYRSVPSANLTSGKSQDLRVTRLDHTHLHLSQARIGNDSIIGYFTPPMARRELRGVALTEVQLVEVRHLNRGRTALAGLAITAAGYAVLTFIVHRALENAGQRVIECLFGASSCPSTGDH